MLASGVLLLSLGLPCVALGLYFRTAPPESDAPQGKKKRKKQKSTHAGPARSGAQGRSLIIGGAAFALLGLAFIALHFAR